MGDGVLFGSDQPLREFAGHKNIQFTYDTYGHLFPKKDHSDLMDKVAGDWLP